MQIARERIAAKMKKAEDDAARKAKADADEAMTMQAQQASFRDMYRVEQTRDAREFDVIWWPVSACIGLARLYPRNLAVWVRLRQ